MKIPSIKRIIAGDYDVSYNQLVNKLAGTLNNTLELFQTVLNQRASLTDNLLVDLKTISVTVNSSGTPTATQIFTVSNANITTVQGIEVIRAVNPANSVSYVTTHPFISYTVQQNQTQNTNTITVQVTNVTGLPANTKFDLTIIVWG